MGWDGMKKEDGMGRKEMGWDEGELDGTKKSCDGMKTDSP